MPRWKRAAAALMVVACDPGTTAPTIESARSPRAAFHTHSVGDAPEQTLLVLLPGDVVATEAANGAVGRAWIEANLIVRDGGARADGAILVVSALDGPMPQASGDATSLRIDVHAASIDASGVIRFEGVGTLRDRTGDGSFAVAGTAGPAADCCRNDGYIVWDIVGGNVHATMKFSARTIIRQTAL